MDLRLRGKSALITGGSKGIGLAIANRLAAEGCRVGICGRDPGTLAEAEAELGKAGVQVFTAEADVTEPGAAERFVERAAAVFGGVDLLVANVGGSVGGGLLESTPQEWARTFDVNVGHAVRAIRAVVPYLQAAAGGSIVVISSISGSKPSPRAQYGAAKAAEKYIVGAFARELAPYRIRVNAVSPGSVFFPGGGWDGFSRREPALFDDFVERDFPAGRLGTPDEIADVVTFLLSERANWVNGADIPVDGAQGRPSARGY